MTRAVLAEFSAEANFTRACAAAPERGLAVLGAYAPYLPEAAHAAPGERGPAIVTAALAIGGFAAAAAFYGLEWWSATHAYPFDSGGRAPDSWPAFIMGPFEFGVFAAGFCGFVALLLVCGLPRPHDPIFEAAAIERVTQDRFVLALAPGEGVQDFAFEMGALAAGEAQL